MAAADLSTLRSGFAELHRSGTFVIPNPWDVGSARILAMLGFPAVATTSSGFAASLGRMDQRVTLEELLSHVRALAGAVQVPISVDAEHCYSESTAGIASTVDLIAEAGAAGLSIEDYSPVEGLFPPGLATERVAVAAETARRHGLTLTGRAENHLYGVDDLDDTVSRLRSYRDAGADVLYAPGLADPESIRRVVEEVEAPVNVLLLRDGPSVPQLAALGVRRVSVGGSLAFAAFGALASAARGLLGPGAITGETLSPADRTAAFEG